MCGYIFTEQNAYSSIIKLIIRASLENATLNVYKSVSFVFIILRVIYAVFDIEWQNNHNKRQPYSC